MKWKIRSIGSFLFLVLFSCVSHASGQKNESVTSGVRYLSQTSEEKNAMNEAIRFYLEKNPPEIISKVIYAAV